MSMCGHATIGAAWLLHLTGQLAARPTRRPDAQRSRVDPYHGAGGRRHRGRDIPARWPYRTLLDTPTLRDDILDVLGIDAAQLAPLPIQNASTSRVKTPIPLASPAHVDALRPRFERIEALCERLGLTGSIRTPRSTQTVRSSTPGNSRCLGRPEDPATGIAASALPFGLSPMAWSNRPRASLRFAVDAQCSVRRRYPCTSTTRQVPLREGLDGCWLAGTVRFEQTLAAS